MYQAQCYILSKDYMIYSLQQTLGVYTMIIPIVYMRKLRLYKVKCPRSALTFGGRGGMLQEWDNQHCVPPDVMEHLLQCTAPLMK